MANILGTIAAKLTLDIQNFSSNLSKVQNDVQATENKLSGISKASDSFTSAGKKLTLGLTTPIVGLGTAAVAASTSFESGMSKVQAISGATSDQMVQLKDKAIEMGAKTKFSAKESADAFTYMAMAGWDTEAMLNGIDGIMNLAAADGLDLATTSDIVTDALTAFGLQASDSAHFADVLATASSSANTNVEMMGETFKYVAPVAGSLGYSVEDTAVAIGLMANAGIKGSQAGTALRASLTRMAKPTGDAAAMMEQLGIEIFNADGTAKSFDEVMNILRSTMGGLSEEQQAQAAATIFGQEAMSGMLAIINASDADYQKLTANINNADGAAQKMAETMMDNTAGSIEQMRGALETLAITLGDILSPIIRNIADQITRFAEWLNSLDTNAQTFIITIAGLIAAIGPLLMIFGTLMGSITKIATGFTTLKSGIGLIQAAFTTTGGSAGILSTILSGLGTAFSALLTPVGLVVAAITGLLLTSEQFRTSVVNACMTMWETVQPTLQNIWNLLMQLWNEVLMPIVSWLQATIVPVVMTVINTIISLIQPLLTAIEGILNFLVGVFTGNWEQAWTGIQQIVSGIWEAIKVIIKGAIDFVGSILEGGMNLIRGIIDGGMNVVKGIIEGIWNGITSFMSGLVSTFLSLGSNIINGLVNGIRGIINNVKTTIVNGVNGAINWLKSLPGQAISWGRDMIQGFINGITSMIGGIISTVSNIAGTVARFLHFSRPDEGPLHEYEKWMPDMIEGLSSTMEKAAPELYRTVRKLATGVSDEFDPTLTAGIETPSGYVSTTPGGIGNGSKVQNDNRQTVINLNIAEFHNETEQDIRDLTREIMEVAEEENKRQKGVFDNV